MIEDRILQACLEEFPYVQLQVTGDCMRPALAPGDLVHVAGRGSRRPRLGDIVLFRTPEGLRLHRLVWGPPLARPGRAWRTRADRFPRNDAPTVADHVLGTVIAAFREGRSQPPEARLRRWLRAILGGTIYRFREFVRPIDG